MADTKIKDLTLKNPCAATDEFPINDVANSNVDKKLTIQQIADFLMTRINGNSGASGEYKTLQKLSSNATTVTTVAGAVVMTTTGVGVGTWKIKYLVIYRSAATTTGLNISINHTGTTGTFVMDWFHITTGGAAATGIGDQSANVNAGQMAEGKSERAINTVTSSSAGVDTANADMLAVVEAVLEVTGSGDLQLKVGTEVAGSGITVQADTLLELTKIG